VAIPGSNGANALPKDVVAMNLLALAGNASASELASIEEAIIRLVKDERIPPDVFLILWSFASKGNSETQLFNYCNTTTTTSTVL
jgi:condensin complex subunit 1